MKRITIFALATALVSAALYTVGAPAFPGKPASEGSPVPVGRPVPADTAAAGKGFAVIELFTSEGCSSCPPADELIARVQKEDKDLPVYILSYHVDYWDRLGWKDVFSDAACSRRQNRYAEWLKLSSVYTPQVVVNGRNEFVGSQAALLHNAIEKSLQQEPAARLRLKDGKIDHNQVSWSYHTEGAGKNFSLVVAIVQRSATTKVGRGENGGRTLSHVQIVRNFESLTPKADGTGQMDWPAGVSPQETELIAFLQNNDNGEIIAATSAATVNKL